MFGLGGERRVAEIVILISNATPFLFTNYNGRRDVNMESDKNHSVILLRAADENKALK